jgi:hypothetical protein
LLRAAQDMEWLERWIARAAADGIPRGTALGTAGQELILRVGARVAPWPTLLPVAYFPESADMVAFEELRRALRAAGD